MGTTRGGELMFVRHMVGLYMFVAGVSTVAAIIFVVRGDYVLAAIVAFWVSCLFVMVRGLLW